MARIRGREEATPLFPGVNSNVQALSQGATRMATPARHLSLLGTPEWKRVQSFYRRLHPEPRGSHVFTLGWAGLDPMGKGPSTRHSPSCPAPRPGSRREPRWPTSGQGRHGTILAFPHKGSFGLSFVWSLPQDLFAMGGSTRVTKPQATELLGSLGHANPSTTIRWQLRRGASSLTFKEKPFFSWLYMSL